MVISLTSFDETWKWDKYAAALPVSQAEIVKSRYAFALLMALVGFVVALAANLIAQAAFGAGRLGTCLLVAVASFFLTLLVLAVLFPSNYRLGVNAGVAVMILFLVAILALWFMPLSSPGWGAALWRSSSFCPMFSRSRCSGGSFGETLPADDHSGCAAAAHPGWFFPGNLSKNGLRYSSLSYIIELYNLVI